ncbi:MAG: hypothetical protein WC909_03430 [Candidatus Paceibacterota bacterium]|jgi:hypothetical protein
MKKFNQKTEEGILIGLALFVLLSSLINPSISIIVAIIGLIIVFAYNYFTK